MNMSELMAKVLSTKPTPEQVLREKLLRAMDKARDQHDWNRMLHAWRLLREQEKQH
jgi:hypothetical protein